MGWKRELAITEQVSLYRFVNDEGNHCKLIQQRKKISLDKQDGVVDENVFQNLYAYKLPDRVGYEFIWISIICDKIMEVRVITPDELEEFMLYWTTKLDQESGIIRTNEEETKTPKFPRYRNMRTKK